MDYSTIRFDNFQRHLNDNPVQTASTTLGYGIATLYILHQIVVFFGFPILSPHELLWNALVFVIPAKLLLDSAKRQELKANDMLSQTHAAKSEALRRVFGVGGNTILQSLPGEGLMRRASGLAPRSVTSDAPPGLGNWDNSCYQNSVLQGLASLDSLRPFLKQSHSQIEASDSTSTGGSLSELVGKLTNPENNGRQLWTPAKLKSMSSWQQQDAQEYFSKIMDELDKEAAKGVAAAQENVGLRDESGQTSEGEEERISVNQKQTSSTTSTGSEIEGRTPRNPLEGLLAQRVACTRCGFSEGLSMIPFNCLTVPLGSAMSYSVEGCLSEYTSLEEISEVDCSKCTLLRRETSLNKLLRKPQENGSERTTELIDASRSLSLPPEVRALVAQRLQTVRTALENDDFADKTLNEVCEVPKNAHVSSTKTRQAVIGRAPQSLVVHVNRSVFDELTGAQRKNHASVRYPKALDLRPWLLGGKHQQKLEGVDKEGLEAWQMDAKTSMLASNTSESPDDATYQYHLKAVVTHYGRHENGHYICYRRHAVHSPLKEETEALEPEDDTPDGETAERWWRLSDEDVSPVSGDDVLAQGGVFMLFYERGTPERPLPAEKANASVREQTGIVEEAVVPIESHSNTPSEAHTLPLSPDASEFPQLIEAATASSPPLPTANNTTGSTQTEQVDPITENTIEDESEHEHEQQTPEPTKPAQAPLQLRTSHGRNRGGRRKLKGRNEAGIVSGYRAMATT